MRIAHFKTSHRERRKAPEPRGGETETARRKR